MKKFFAMVVAVAMVLSLALPAFAMTQTLPHGEDEGKPGATPADAVSFSVEAPATVEAGEEFTATVSISGTYEAHTLNFQLNYDVEAFQATGTTRGDVLMQVIDLGGTQILDYTTIPGSIRLGVMMPTDPMSAEGAIFTAKFVAKDDIADGVYTIEPVVAEFSNYPVGGANTPIESTATGATVTVGNPATATPAPATATPAPTAPPAPGVIWDFEQDPIAQGFTFLDQDGDGNNWYWHMNTGMGNYSAHSGDGVAASNSYDNDSGMALTPNNWMLTPAFTGGSITFWMTAQDPSYSNDFIGVYVSTDGGNTWSDELFGQMTPTSYQQFTVDLSAYAGQTINVAFRHYNSYDMFIAVIDDIEVSGASDPGDPTPVPTTAPTTAPTEAPTTAPVDPGTGIIWDFEQDPVAQGFAFLDQDGDGHNWEWMYGAEYSDHTHHEGIGFMASESYVNYVGALTPDNWMVTPEFSGTQLTFWAAGQDPSWAAEYLGVFVSVDGGSSWSNEIFGCTLTGSDTQYTVDLSAYANVRTPIKVAIRHYNVTDMFRANVDYIEVLGGSSDQPTPAPTAAPTTAPTAAPTAAPTEAPTPAPGQVVFTVEAPERVEAGEEFQVSVRIEGEYESHGLNLQLNYDEANFTILSHTRGDVLMQVIDLGGTQIVDFTTLPGSIRIGYMMPTDPVTEEGIIVTFNVKASDDIADGQYCFMPVVTEFINFPLGGENTPIDNIAYPAYVTVGEVVEPTPEPADPTDEPVDPTDEPTSMASFTVDHVEAVPGALVPVTVHVEGDYLAHGLTYWLDYDAEMLTVESVENGDLMNDVLELGGFNVLDYETVDGSIRFAAVAPMPEQPFTTNGTVFTVYFRVSEDAQVGDVYELVANVTDMVYMPDSDEIAVESEFADGSITIVASEPGEPTPEPTTPPAPPTGTIAMVGAGIAAVVAGAGIVLFRKKED